MKIAIVCGAGYVYGREIITLSLIEGLRDRGHEVSCITSTWSNGEFEKSLTGLSISFESLPLGFISKTLTWSAIGMTLDQLRMLPNLWLGFRRNMRKVRPDVVLYSNIHHVFLLWPLLSMQAACFHVHDTFPPTRFNRALFRLINTRIRLFIGVSQFIGETIVKLGVPRAKVKAVLNGISAEDDSSGNLTVSKCLEMNQEQARSDRGPVSIGIVGQIGEWKGHTDLIEALRQLKNAKAEFSCTVFGDGSPEYVQSLKKKAHEYGLEERIRWAGFVQKREDIFRNIDICIVPSRQHDPCPTVAIEASHFGIPIVATRKGGLPEIVVDGETGYLVEESSPQDIAAKLETLLSDSDLRLQLGSRAREHALKHFGKERMVDQIENLLTQLRAPSRLSEFQSH